MPKKTIPNQVVFFHFEDVMSIFTHMKKNHFDSESKLFNTLVSTINSVNPNYSVHLTTYPYVAVHIAFGLVNELEKNRSNIEKAIQKSLEMHLRQT